MPSILIDPMQGTKLMIEGPFAKSGKTLLAAELTIISLDMDPDLIGFGNFEIKHDQFEKRKYVDQSFFDPNRDYLCVLDEVDIRYSYQKAYWNEGLLAFWGFGASHNKCAIVSTVQREYHELETKYLRQFHIVIEELLWNSQTHMPFAVTGYFTKPFQIPFTQNIEVALGRYDPYEKNVERTDFYDFTPEVLERKRIKDNDEERKPRSKLYCESCGWTWTPKTDHPLQCPRCNRKFGYRVVE